MVEKEAQFVGGTTKKSRVERTAVVVEIDRFGVQELLGVCLPCAPLIRQMQNQNQAIIQW